MHMLLTVIFTLAGYTTSHIISHPKSKINKILPSIKFRNVEFMPSLKITIKGKVIHFHHWFNFTILLCISIFVTSSFLDSWLTRGFLIGGVAQGLKFTDRGVFHNIKK